MDENTNQPSTTPLGNERRDNPGQTKIIENANGDSIIPGMPAWTDDTSLEDIAKQYTGIGGKYNDLVENAADNVGDRQVQLVGNDFGATNPYMFNTYYEPAATSFASEMRQQGTQKALEVGLDRAEEEAQKNAQAAQNRYNNAVAAAKQREEARKNAKMHVSETDMDKLPEGVTEQELINYYNTGKMSEDDVRNRYTSEGIKQIQENGSPINFDIKEKRKDATSKTKTKFPELFANWESKSQAEKDAVWAREDVGNYWTEQYMLNYFEENSTAGKYMAESFNELNERVDNVVKAIKSKDLSTLKNIDISFPGVQVKFTADQEAERIKKAIRETDKLSDEEKNKYISTIEAERLSSDSNSEVFMRMWHEIESKQVKMESNRQLESWDPDHKWVKNGMQVDTKTYDDVWEIMKLFAETEEAMGMSIADKRAGMLHYADVEPEASSNYGQHEGQLMDDADRKQLDRFMTRAFGIDVDSWEKMAKLESERPDDYKFLRDHANFVMAGGAGAFEQITDKDKKYFINGKYWSASDKDSPIAVGDFIFHTLDGTINSDGEYSDPQLKEFINDYRKIYSGDLDASEENIKKLEANYNTYANRVARAMFLSGNYGTSINGSVYSVILALDGVSEDKLEVVNPSNPNEKMSVAAIKDWFESLSEDARYTAYTTLSRKARESRGVMILSDDKTGQLYDAGVKQNGKDTIGKYNEKDSASDMRVAKQIEQLSNTDCLALLFYIDNGIKNGTISNEFMDNEGVDIPDAWFNGIYNNLKGAAQFFGSVAAVGVGALLPKDEDGLNDAMRWGAEVWDDMTTMSEGDDWMHDSGQSAMNPYTQQMREQQRANLNHMIDTTFNLDYFNVENTVDPNTGEVKDKDGNVISLDNTHFNHMDQGKAFLTGAASMGGAIAEFMLETALTAGVGKLLKAGAKGASSLIRKGARAVATKSPTAAAAIRASSKFIKGTAKFLTTPVSKTAVQSALQASHAANYLDDVARQYGDDLVKGIAEGEIKTASDVINTVGKTSEAVNAARNSADDVARATLKEAENTAVEGLKNYADDAAEAVAKGETMVDDLVKGATEQADDVSRKLTKKEAQTLLDNIKEATSIIQKDYAIRYGLDVVADNVDDAARSLSQRILDKVDEALTNTHVFKGANDSVRSLLKNNLTDAVSRAAVNGRLSAATGMSASRIANLSDDAASVLYGMLRVSESSADDVAQYALRGVSRMQAVSADVVLKNVDFKKAAAKVVEASESLAVKGGQLGLDDVFRLIATEGSVNPGDLLKVLKRYDFVKDRVVDWSRDIAQNYWTPELDEHFESHYIDFDTYLHSPEQWLLSAGFDLGVTLGTRVKNYLKLNFYESKIDKILGDVDLSTANKADRAKFRKQMVKLDNLRAKASKLNGQILDRKVSFEHVHDVADKAERAVKNQIDLISDNIDIAKTSDLIQLHKDEALDEARAALAKGGFGSKRKYKQILADADQFNRMIVRGNDKLAAVQEASQALQQVSITRYLDIDAHSKTIHKLNGEQWGKTMSLAWKEVTDSNFMSQYGDELGIDGKAFTSNSTINFKDPAKTKAAYAAGQTLVYDTIFKNVRKVMGNSLTKSEYADLRIELNGIRDRMIAAGNQMIDDGRKVRWNYMPTQALTWESEPGSMSAVRALWGWDYKGGVHMTPAGEIANPLLARDQWDFSKIIDDFDNGQNTFKRRKGDREIELEKVKNPGATIDELKDINYNWAGFDPAYACNAYLNSVDSARIIQPMLDPINGVVVNSPAMAKNVLHTSNIVLDNELATIKGKYNDRVEKELAKRSKAKAGRTSKVSLEHRAKLMEDFSNNASIRKGLGADSEAKITKLQSQSVAADARIKQRVHESPMVKSLEPLYARNFINDRVPAEAKASYIIGKMDTAYNELGQDIKAVRDMYTKAGNIKKKYLNSDGTIKEAFRDAQGNLIPEGVVSGTFNNVNGTQYREFVNQLAQNKRLKSDYFESNSARVIKFDDGTQINANAFQKNIYDVLATKQVIDLGMDPNYKVQLFPEKTGYNGVNATESLISKRLQPIDLDSNKARSSLTSETRKIFDSLYGEWSDGDATGKGRGYKIKRGSAEDKFFQNAISNAFDEAEATGGEITTYDFVQLVDKHIPDFIKEAGRNTDTNVNDFFKSMGEYIRAYENSGGNAEKLLRDLDNALDAERAAKNPNAKNIAALTNTIDAIRGAYDYDQRTINRASFNESLDYEINETDFGSDAKLTAGDVIADTNTSGQVEGFSNLYVPKGVDENLIGGVENESATSSTLKITPTKNIDAKAASKGSISNKFIGFADGIEGSSTAEYAKQAGAMANVGTYSPDDVVFVSVPGKRGDAKIRLEQQNKTIAEAIKALDSGATIITDNADYVAKSAYNEGEKRLSNALTARGYQYSETTVNGDVVGVWKASGQSEMSLDDWMYTELNRHQRKPRYDDKTISALVDKYQDKIAKAQTADEITNISDEIAADLVPLDPNAKTSATKMKQVASDIQNAIFWARQSASSTPAQTATFEASTAGHKEFSALNAKFAAGTEIMGIDIGGRTIEDVYQKTLKGSGKNKAPATDSILGKATADAEKKAGRALTKAEKETISQRYYDRLWDIWGEQNPELKAQIENLPAGTKITDQFAKTGVSQANSLQRWVKSTSPDQLAQTPSNTVSRNIGTDIKNALDILASRSDSDYATKISGRAEKREAYDSLKKSFYSIADKLDKKANGKQIYRGNDILLGASDNQYLAFAAGDHTTPWMKGENPGGVDNVTARRALIAGSDRAGDRSFGNINFWKPEEIDAFIRNNGISVDDKLSKEIDAYKAEYAAKAAVVSDPALRGRVSDTTLSLQNSIPEYLASKNDGSKSTFDLNKNSKKHDAALDYHSEAERYSSGDARVIREAEAASEALDRKSARIDARGESTLPSLQDLADSNVEYTPRMDEMHNVPSSEAYGYDNGDVDETISYNWDERTAEINAERVRNTPYIDFLDQSKKSNISQAAVDLNEVFYGNGDKDGYFDYKNKLAQKIDEEMAVVSDNFDTNITDKVTALKELDGAKDGEVVDILKAARKQADEIENPNIRKYVTKRIDDEIKFAEENLELTEKTKAKVAEAFAEHDPEYQAALEAKRRSNMKPTGAQISAAVPNGANPVFVSGNMTPDGHISLQQLVDARNEVKLSRKNGKNTWKSSAETKKVLNAMRKEMEYDGSTLITEGPARRQDTWILNLYKRVYDSAGDPLPKVPTFEDLENGFMEYNGKKISLDLKLSEIYIDPKIASLGHTYWGEGRTGMIENFYKAATAVSGFNKAIQDIQLAGGLGQYNAFTLRNAITMMWQDPWNGTRALFSNFHNARTNESVVQFYLNNHEKLLKMAIDTGDYSALNAFTNVINARDEVTGRGVIAEMGHAIMDMPDNIKKEGVIAGLWDTTSKTYEAMFNNPTFVRWAAVAKADMQLRNYDHATRFVNRIMAKYGLKDEDFAKMEGGMGTKDKYIAHLAQMRTDRYWTPSKFITSGGNTDKYLQKQNRLSLQQTADSLRGMPQKKTLRQCLSDFFFAIGYKLQMNAHPVMGIGSIFTALPNNLRASSAIRNRTSFSVMTSRFAGRGDRNEAIIMIGIAALAHAWNTHIGAPSAFEELFSDHGKEENGTYGIAQSLMNFQDFGKIWMPNTQNGTFDPTQRGASVDPFFSIFTLQNSAMRAANKAFFPNQIPINTQRTFYQEDNQNLIARMQGVSDELIGANLLSGYKAIYEVLNNSTYFGNNIWERKYLPDGSVNKNYNPLRNLMASVAHIMNLEEVMLGDTTNRWVKGLDIDTKTWRDGEQVDPYSVGPKIGEAGKYNGRTGTVAGSGIIQHEYLTALKKANNGDYFDALTESMELPFKTRNYASRARTQLNTEVIAALRNAKKEYDNKVSDASPEEKDKAYAEFAKKAVNIMHDWSAKNSYALGSNDELTAAATKILVSFMADEYDDVTNRVQNRYDKLRQELKMADGDQFLFSKAAMDAAIADGMSDSEAAELHNKHLTALKEAQIKEYKARKALVDAGLDPNVFNTVDYINDDASAKSASFDKKTYTEILGKLEAPVGEFKNYKEMKAYYETRISEATTTKQKAKLANMYNEQVLGVIAPYIEAGYGAAAFNNIYWDGDNLSNKLGPYIILPADKYYGGKYPRTNYLKDMLGIGYRDNKNLPSDKQINEQLHKVAVSLSKGNISSASALVDNALVQLRKGYWHAAPADYDKLIRMRALLSSRSK